MKRLIIHAGLPKTGSSALQVFLARNYAALRRQSYEYFRLGEFSEAALGKISAGNGFLIARSLFAAGDPSAAENPSANLAALARAIAASTCETGLLSSEYFADCDPDRLKTWVANLRAAGTDAKMIYYIRSQSQALSSMYAQHVKRSLCRETPQGFVERVYRAVPYLKHASFYKTQAEIFGAGNVICQDYEAALRGPNSLPQNFLTAIGADPSGLPFPAEAINTGLSLAELAIMRELNKYRPHTRLSDQLVNNSRMAGHALPGETYTFLPEPLNSEIETYFAAENAEMAKLYFGREQLFVPAPAANGAASVEDFSKQDLLNVLGGLLVRYDERLAHLESQRQKSWLGALKRQVRKFIPA